MNRKKEKGKRKKELKSFSFPLSPFYLNTNVDSEAA